MTRTNVTQSCPYSPHSVPVGCQPASNILPLGKEFAKGKMFCVFSKFDGQPSDFQERLLLQTYFVNRTDILTKFWAKI